MSEAARARHALGRGPMRASSQDTGGRPRPAGAEAQATSSTLEVCGVVLCGGSSRRMGHDKAALELGGRSLLERAVERLDRHCGRVVLACGPEPRYAELGRELVLDLPLDQAAGAAGPGPIAGILAVLEAIECERALVLACDMPRAEDELLAALLERARATAPDVLFFESERGIEPLCAVYSRRCRQAMRAALAAGERRVLAFLEHPLEDGTAVRAERLRERDLAPELRARDCALNLNTPDELVRERVFWQEESKP